MISAIAAEAASTRRSTAIAATRGTPSGIDVLRYLHRPPREHGCEHGTENREDETLDHQLPDQTPASRAERRADADFTLTRSRAREQQVGDVGTGDEQHDTDRPKQHEHPRFGAGPEHVIDQRPDANQVILVPHRVRVQYRRADLRHLSLGLLERHARLQPRDALQVIAARADHTRAFVRRNDVRDPQVGWAQRSDRILEIGRHDPDHFVGAPLERNRAADDAGVAGEPPAPQSITEDDEFLPSVDFVVGRERPANRRADAEHVEEPGGDPLRAEVLRFRPWLPQCDGAAGDRCDRLEHLLLRDPVGVILGRDAADGIRIPIGVGIRPGSAPFADRDEAVVLVERQSAQHDGIDNREDRGGCANAERQDDQGDGRERFRGSQRAKRGLKIVCHGLVVER